MDSIVDNKIPYLSGKMDNPVFLIGSPRSGTTLTYDVLMVSGQFPGYNAETHLLDVNKPLYGDISDNKNRNRFLENWVKSEQFKRSGLDKDMFLDSTSRCFSNYGEFLRLFMGQVARSQGKKRWLEKTPGHIFEVQNLVKWFPDAKFLHVIRDGRDVALSLRSKGWLSTNNSNDLIRLISAARLWYRAIGFGDWLGNAVGDRYMEFRYEDLVQRDTGLLDRINCFAGMDLSYELIDKKGTGALRGGNSTYGQRMIGLSEKGMCRWKDEMSGVEKSVITYLLKDVLSGRGYEVGSPIPDFPLRFTSRALWSGQGLAITAKYWIRHNTYMGRFLSR